MTDLVAALSAALQSLGIPVIRGWPQAPVALPSCTISVLDDRISEDSARLAAMGITLRALMPEEADALARQADQLLTAQGWRRTGCKDGAERDGSCFHKALRFEGTFPQMEMLNLTAAGQAFTAAVLKREWERPVTDRTALTDSASRLATAKPPRLSLRLRVVTNEPAELAQRLLTGPVIGGGSQWLAVSITQTSGGVETTLLATQ